MMLISEYAWRTIAKIATDVVEKLAIGVSKSKFNRKNEKWLI